MYYKVPVIDGRLDMNYDDCIDAIVIDESEALIHVKNKHDKKETWVEIAQSDFENVKPKEDITYQLSLQDIAEENLLETKYQTALLELLL